MKSLYEILHKTRTNPLYLHSFGCLCFPWLHLYIANKIQPRSKPCLFIGYSPPNMVTTALIQLLVASVHHIMSHFMTITFHTPHSPKIQYQWQHSNLHHHTSQQTSPCIETRPSSQPKTKATMSRGTSATNNQLETSIPNNKHPMVTWSKNQIYKPKKALNASKHPLNENFKIKLYF